MNQHNKYRGERLDLTTSLSSGVLCEHLSRYAQVSGEKDCKVLDIGCGAGHGSHALAQRFNQVWGVDISSEAIEDAQGAFKLPGLIFKNGSALDIPYPDNMFDIVAAFEVFEHIPDWKKFLNELRRVVKPGGSIYISTPNKDIYSPGTDKPRNPFHCFEMRIEEFRDALAEHFEIKALYGQRTPIYNDHPIWNQLELDSRQIPPDLKNSIKLVTCNWIKPCLELSDIQFSNNIEHLRHSRFMLAICQNSLPQPN